MSPVLHSGLRDATATDAKGPNARHRAGDNPAGCRLAKLVANLGIHRPTPHYSHSGYTGGSPRHCPLCAAGRDSGSRWTGVAARSRPGRSCRSGRAHWQGDLLQPIAPSISAITPSGPERRLRRTGPQPLREGPFRGTGSSNLCPSGTESARKCRRCPGKKPTAVGRVNKPGHGGL
jgi:hypothetical protein